MSLPELKQKLNEAEKDLKQMYAELRLIWTPKERKRRVNKINELGKEVRRLRKSVSEFNQIKLF